MAGILNLKSIMGDCKCDLNYKHFKSVDYI